MGKFRVERVLGVGGMGVVVAAHHMELDERVALKFLLPIVLEDAEAVGRFAREARAAVKIKSEHVARVTDVGQLPNGSPYIVMEYLHGLDLSAWVEERGPLPATQAVEFVLQACEALAEAHMLGIIHRDLKPSNLFCIQRADGQLSIKVLDFGISKVTGAAAEKQLTQTADLMGSPHYMSPEQMRSSKAVDARTDVWSLGVILYELVSGVMPFDGATAMEIAVKVATEQPASLRVVRADAPAALEQVVSRCLEKDRDARYRDIGELALALRDLAPPSARASVDRILGTFDRPGLSSSGGPALDGIPSVARSVPVVSTMAVARTEARLRRPAAAPAGTSKLQLGVIAVVAACGLGTIAWRASASASARNHYNGAVATFERCAADANVECASSALEALRSADADNDRTKIAETELRVLQGDADGMIPLLARFIALGGAASRGGVRMAPVDPSGALDPDMLSKLDPAVRGDLLLLSGDIAALRGDGRHAEGRWGEAASIVGESLVAPRRARLAATASAQDARVSSELDAIEGDFRKLFELARAGSDATSYALSALRGRAQAVQPLLAAQKLGLALDATAHYYQIVRSRMAMASQFIAQRLHTAPPVPPSDEELAKRPSLQSQYARQKAAYDENVARWQRDDAARARYEGSVQDQQAISATTTMAEAESLLGEGLALARPKSTSRP